MQIALAWILRYPDLIVIPKASSPEHIRENRDAHDIKLTERDVQELDHASRRRDARRRSTWANYLFAVSDREVYH